MLRRVQPSTAAVLLKDRANMRANTSVDKEQQELNFSILQRSKDRWSSWGLLKTQKKTAREKKQQQKTKQKKLATNAQLRAKVKYRHALCNTLMWACWYQKSHALFTESG